MCGLANCSWHVNDIFRIYISSRAVLHEQVVMIFLDFPFGANATSSHFLSFGKMLSFSKGCNTACGMGTFPSVLTQFSDFSHLWTKPYCCSLISKTFRRQRNNPGADTGRVDTNTNSVNSQAILGRNTRCRKGHEISPYQIGG